MHLDILYEDNHLLAISKPVELPTMGVPDDRASLLALAKEYIKHRYNKPGNVYLGAMSRLDAPVSGVVLFARTSKAASRLDGSISYARSRKNVLGLGGRLSAGGGRLYGLDG